MIAHHLELMLCNWLHSLEFILETRIISYPLNNELYLTLSEVGGFIIYVTMLRPKLQHKK